MGMRKLLLFILFLGIAAILWHFFVSPAERKAYEDNTRPLVVVSGYVPYTLTKQLAGNGVNLLMLLPPGAEPHAFEPTPGALISLKKAAAFIYISDELEPWANDLAQAAGPQTRVVQLAQTLPKTGDPHLWMNIQNTQQLATEIARVLTQINPAAQTQYQANLEKLNQELTQLDRDFKTRLAACKSHQVVHIGHLAFKNLTDTYGLTLTALAGTSHDGEHSAKKLASLIKEIKHKNIRTIFTEETLSPRLAQTVAQETGAQILPLYPIEHISKTDFNAAVTYTDLMRRNLDSLTRGLQCPA